MTFPKHCSCGAVIESREAWGALDYCGVMDDGVEVVELRTHDCNSTIAIVLGDSPTPDTERAPAVPS